MSNEESESGFTRRQMLRGMAAAGLAAAGPPTGLLGAEPAGNVVVQENQRPGTRDWMLRQTRIDPESRYRSPWIEGYCSHRSSPRRRNDHVLREHESCLALHARHLPHRILRRRRRAARQAIGRIRRERHSPSRPSVRSACGMRMGSLCRIADSARLAERRLPRQAHGPRRAACRAT